MLWRHGRTAWNAEGRMQGQADVDLDAVGEQEARTAASWLAGLRPAALATSDLVRARRTADVLAGLTGLTATAEPGLREVDLGTWSGLTGREAQEQHPEEYAAWLAGADVRRGGGETLAEAAGRAREALDRLVASVPRDGVAVAVTHGATARATLGSLLELPADQWWRIGALGNCRWALLVDTDRGWRLLAHDAGPAGAGRDEDRVEVPDAEPVGSPGGPGRSLGL